jgi:hypothetical protein
MCGNWRYIFKKKYYTTDNQNSFFKSNKMNPAQKGLSSVAEAVIENDPPIRKKHGS